MTDTPLHVIGVGNAIVDVLAKAEDAFLGAHAIPKGGMELIDETRAASIYDAMAPGVEISGGSAANSIACLASLGGKGGFVGKVSQDALGDIFRHDLRALGVAFDTSANDGAPGTGRCLINVTPDAQRSMSTFLGSAGLVAPDDIDADFIKSAAITYFEGYLFEQPVAREAFIKACEAARAAGRKTALTLSDAGVVERQREALEEFIPAHVDILFANHDEAAELFGTSDIAAMADKAHAMCPLVAVTQSEKGSSLLVRGQDTIDVAPFAPEALVDTTGAGDAYAAGVLYGIATQMPLDRAGALGSLAAAEVISHFGARPEEPLEALAKQASLL